MHRRQRIGKEKPQQLLARIRPLSVGVRAASATARPGMAGAMDRQVLGNDPSARSFVDALGVVAAIAATRTLDFGFDDAGAAEDDLLAVG